jgi:hypothetical protein
LAFDLGSRNRLTPRDLPRFGGDTLFERVARVVCEADCLPRKELYEAWEVSRRVRRRFRGGRVVDCAAGHGLAAYLLLLLDDTSPAAIAVDPKTPLSAGRLAAALVERWPRLQGRVQHVEAGLADVPLDANDLVVSVHACGALTDQVLGRAVQASARVAVLPCCHDLETCDLGGLGAWMDGPLAIDAHRAARLMAAGYTVHTHLIPREITPQNRLLMGTPGERLPIARAHARTGW